MKNRKSQEVYGKCFNCGKHGHLAKYWRLPKKTKDSANVTEASND